MMGPRTTSSSANLGLMQALIACLSLVCSTVEAGDDTGCVQVKGWATLDDPVRLCAYLTADTDAEACASRGYRLGEGLTETEVELAGQFLLLCSHEYVIEVRRAVGEADRLLVITAYLSGEGMEAADAGYYNSGRQRVLEKTDGGWVERPSAVTWTE
jgi:hypothetical protein